MSKGDESEEKSLPATKKKLRDARKKGQVATSKDLVVAAATSVALLYCWLDAGNIRDSLTELLTIPPSLYDKPFTEAAYEVAGASIHRVAVILGPLFALIVGICFVAGILSTRGLVFAIDPIIPKPERINPVEGFKKLFSLKNLLELLKQMVKTLLLTVIVVVILRAGMPALLQSPSCGLDCIGAAFGGLVKPMVAAAVGLLLAAALIDIGLQQFLFGREMRMTKTEHKRERKEEDGDPLIQQARKREARAIAQGAAKTGIKNATVLLVGGEEVAVGLRFVRGETPVPVVVCKGTGANARALVAAAKRHTTPVLDDPALATQLASRVGVGRFIAEDLFNPVARALMKVGKS